MLNKRILVLMFLLVFLPLVGCLPSPALPNQAPIITSDPITTATVGEAYTYDVEATDPDGDTVTYSLATPAGMTINSATGLIEWTPTAKGDYDVVVKVSDGALDITQSFTIVVSKPWAPSWTPPTPPVNRAPIITSIPDLTTIVGVIYTYTIEATDPDGDTVIYSLVSGPAGMTFVAPATISWTPDSGQVGPHDVTVKASDGKKFDTQSFTITVNPRTYTITASAGPGGSINPSGNVIVNEGSNKTFTITPDPVFYSIGNVLVDGTFSMGPESSFTFTNVTGDHTIHASFILVGPVYNLTQNLHYNIIQVAINAADPGDTILVMAGTYPEDVTIGKVGITLQAYNNPMPVIEGTVVITADNVTLDGFSIRSFSCIPCPDWSGVYMFSGTGILVINNLIDGTGTNPTKSIGIQTIYGGTAEATLESNIIRNCNMGIYNQGASLLIEDNTIEDTAHCGIGVDTSLGTIITGNTISDGGDLGIEVFGENVVANFNNITGNTNFGVLSLDWVLGFRPQVDATDNWWGDDSGPSGVGPGTGDAISINVVYEPWSTSEF